MAPDDRRSTQLMFDFGDIPEDAETSLPDEDLEEEDNSSSILSENFLFPPSEEDDGDLSGSEEEDSSFSGSAPSEAEPEKEEEDWEIVSDEEDMEEGSSIPETAVEPSPAPAAETVENTVIPEAVEAVAIPEEEAVSPAPPKKEPLPPRLDSRLLKRASLAFLASLSPSALASDVPTRYRKYVVDGAAFWAEPDRKGVMQVVRTAIVETRLEKALCNDCADPAGTINALSAARQERLELEKSIRENEPELREADSLFSEHAAWHYEKSKNPLYKELLKKIRHLEYTLFHGSSFDKLRKAKVATEFYLLVPEGEVLPDSIAESWGLVLLRKDLTFQLVKEAAPQDCPESHRRHLALNIARSTLSNVLFANGIHPDPLAGPILGKLPRKRRNPL